MIDSMLDRLNMSIEHCSSASSTHSMPDAMNIQPFLSAFLSTTDLISNNWIKNFGPSARNRSQARFTQDCECISNRHSKNTLREVTDFNSSESFNVKGGIKCAKTAQKI